MQKYSDYDEVSTNNGFTPITEGGHHLIIKQVNQTVNKNADPMTVILFDFADNDSQKGLIAQDFANDERPDKKWPHRGTNYCTNVMDGKTTRNFKTFCTCYERSNNTEIKWDPDDRIWAAQFKNKKIGAMFGKVHSVYQGREQVKVELRWFLSDDKVDGAGAPKEKMLTDSDKKLLAESTKGIADIPDDVSADELPFA